MKRVIKLLLIILFPFWASAQQSYTDSLLQVLKTTSADSIKYKVNQTLSLFYEEKNFDSSLYFANEAVQIAHKANQKLLEGYSLNSKGYQLLTIGKYGESLQCLMNALTILEDPASEKANWHFSPSFDPRKARLHHLAVTHHMYALLMDGTRNIDQEIFHYKEEIRIAEEINAQNRIQLAYMNLGSTYLRLNKADTALLYAKKAALMAEQSGDLFYQGWTLSRLGDIYLKMNEDSLARQYYHSGINISREQKNLGSLVKNYDRLTRYYLSKNIADSGLFYAEKTFEAMLSLGTKSNIKAFLADGYENLYTAYKIMGNRDSAYKYQELTLLTRDSLFKDDIKNLSEFQNLSFNEQMRLRELEKEKVKYQNKVTTYALLGGLGVFLLIAVILYRGNRQKNNTNKVLGKTLSDLRSTQSQLIQSEKMASLGELTAGIAHEIQNPLNFVNNFSEVNKELLTEMYEEIEKGNYEEVKAIAKDVTENEDKIMFHGKRADSIVKGMLQHSRSSSGVKEPTDINALADEYLRLAYHGLRAKDKSFNATMKTDFDNSIGKINIIPQDIGRVVLNLITNAFYVVDEKKKIGVENYEPTVTVSTKHIPLSFGEGRGEVKISVKDNGNGIPQKILDKIFQPFFTTKPTGQGTGLGLSMSYDIVTKGHGGELKVETREGEGSTFIIILPI